MKISAINTQQHYNNVNFQGRGNLGNKHYGRRGAVLGGITGLMMTGAMMATCPVDWQKIKTWPIMGIALTTAGAHNGKLIGDIFENKNKREK